MPQTDSEQERLKRLRDNQLAARDPQVKQRQLQQVYIHKSKNQQGQHVSFRSVWADIPHIFKSPFYGFLLGLMVLWGLPQVWISRFAVPGGFVCMFVFFIIGLVIGHALDVRDNIRDLSR
ncbi:MAG: hypothetical protein A2X25_02260 [Chloroflexi bacterium GWB2_49_20]|nr:MAG: hypothetical protein A2X25_02260 [Chloroflexi bacterium GWB2_49_20]OGN78268.1 MAG: hypothetical protein A2X26_14865 [Chloroflexi bacterium GWC2_49_37]OGN85304.1 MAG: hypothetical protein A2X27_07520 [Chloroflexi bacterium GWD2_49_16]